MCYRTTVKRKLRIIYCFFKKADQRVKTNFASIKKKLFRKAFGENLLKIVANLYCK